ncbi:hypothetical protein ACIA03_08470 [Nocardioides sp. NPDC051685]|uniref:hypothetical protein n=1 Tax=Nocardioides sp. NPDC051685 TaxID=3364334 RepID=UPI00378F31D3
MTTGSSLGGDVGSGQEIRMVAADVRKSAQSIESAADQAAKIKLGDHIAAVSSAMPGSNSAGPAGRLQADWDSDMQKWTKAAHDHHRGVVAASRSIHEQDLLTAGDAGRTSEAPPKAAPSGGADDFYMQRLGRL